MNSCQKTFLQLLTSLVLAINKQQLLAWLLILCSLFTSVLFFYWAIYTVYDTKQLEQQGHHYYANKQYKKAYSYFYRVAQMTEEAENTTIADRQKLSSRYRFAATAAHSDKNYQDALIMLKKSLEHNPDNQQAIALQKHILAQE